MYSLPCIDCGHEIAPTKPEPRIPLCRWCTDKRLADRQSRTGVQSFGKARRR